MENITLSREDLCRELEQMGLSARKAALELAVAPAEVRNNALLAMAEELIADTANLLCANARDVDAARNNGVSGAMVDRLTLTPERIASMADGLRQVAGQNDPVGRVLEEKIRPNGLKITKVSVPFGVIGIIYESRPNVTSDAAGICLKAGNAVMLRGGSEAFFSNSAIAKCLKKGLSGSGLPEAAVQVLPWIDREAVKAMLKLDRYIDLVIPRGGESLIRMVMQEATMPVLKHYKGVCHLFVDENTDYAQALNIVVNAKCQRPGVCNALETLLVHQNAAPEFLPMLKEEMKRQQVELFGDETVCSCIPEASPATEDDWYREYLSLKLAVKTVSGVIEAVDHINTYGSRHSDGILSRNNENIAYFTGRVDSSTVYVNASTRFTDGGEFGMGAEIGISTDKLHARGPMGADELTSYKYLVFGNGQTR